MYWISLVVCTVVFLISIFALSEIISLRKIIGDLVCDMHLLETKVKVLSSLRDVDFGVTPVKPKRKYTRRKKDEKEEGIRL